MDARETLAAILHREFDPHCDRVSIDTVINDLAAAGYTIIHDGENHGPTLERAAVRAENLGGTWNRGSRDAFSCVQEAAVDDKCEEIASAIRAMGEKK
jgi:hypothetical protein